MSLFDKPQQKY